MSATSNSTEEYKLLETRLRTLLPEEYKDSYEDVQPVSMGSAGLIFGPDGRVAWDEIWGSFCDLAMAGGPPHRGTLLEAATQADVDENPGRYGQVVDELCRGIEMVTGLAAEPSEFAGWLHVDCPSTAMAGWLVRAINMENVSAHVHGMTLHLPAGPHFRLEKEIKNVITSIAKTFHYWHGHTSVAQHRAIGDLLKVMERESPLIQPPFPASHGSTASAGELRDEIRAQIYTETAAGVTGREYDGWLGIDFSHVRAAVWVMRMMVASNVLCRRESTLIYVPVNSVTDPHGHRIARLLASAQSLAAAQKVI